MPPFKAWDIIKVPFPYTDRPVRQRRPALVVSSDGIQDGHGLLWVLMITSAENRGWPGDITVSDLELSGLPAPSVIRTAKIATIEAKDAERMGSLAAADGNQVAQQLSAILAKAGH
jgi:mRNA interferase MazF